MTIRSIRAAVVLALCAGTCLATPPASPEILIASVEIGVTPEAVAASGLHESAETIFTRLVEAEELRAQLTARRVSLSAAGDTVTSLQQALMQTPQNETLRAQYESAVAAVQTLQQQVQADQQALFEEVTDGLSEPAVQTLAIMQLSAARQVPPQFRVIERTGAQWDAIEVALIAERRAQRLGHVLAENHASLLAEVRANFDVITAAANLQSHLASVEAAMAQAAVSQEPE